MLGELFTFSDTNLVKLWLMWMVITFLIVYVWEVMCTK